MFPGNLNKMLAKAQKAQEQMQAEIAALQADGSAGGGAVKVTLDGSKNLIALAIAPEVMEEKDPEILSDLILAAFSDASQKVDSETKKRMGAMMGSLGLPPGFGL